MIDKPPARCDVPMMLRLLSHVEAPTLPRWALVDIVGHLAETVHDAARELDWHRVEEQHARRLLPDLEAATGELAVELGRLKRENAALHELADELRARLARLVDGGPTWT